MPVSDLIPFHFDAHEVRIHIDASGEAWWIAKDVCDVLNIRNPTDALKALESQEKALEKVETLGGTQRLHVVNEAGLYRLIFRSNKPEAKRFQAWVFQEVLPQIRKTGKYIPTTPQVKNPANQLLIDTVVRLDAVEQEAAEAKAEAAQANANAVRALETQQFFTVAEYIAFEKFKTKVPESAYKALSDHLRLYCMDNRIPFRRIQVGGQRWDEEYAFHISVWVEVFPGWLSRRYAQTHLRSITGD